MRSLGVPDDHNSENNCFKIDFATYITLLSLLLILGVSKKSKHTWKFKARKHKRQREPEDNWIFSVTSSIVPKCGIYRNPQHIQPAYWFSFFIPLQEPCEKLDLVIDPKLFPKTPSMKLRFVMRNMALSPTRVIKLKRDIALINHLPNQSWKETRQRQEKSSTPARTWTMMWVFHMFHTHPFPQDCHCLGATCFPGKHVEREPILPLRKSRHMQAGVVETVDWLGLLGIFKTNSLLLNSHRCTNHRVACFECIHLLRC